MSTAPDARHPLAALRDPGTIRARCAAVLRSVEAEVSEHFRLDRSRLPAVAERVAALTLKRFPDLVIPYHSRWRHFEAGGTDRKAALDERLAPRGALESARAQFDLTVVSVLLDAGAGPTWRYTEAGTGQVLQRSEGLGVASFHAFMNGIFSATAEDPQRVDAAALQRLDASGLRAVFQSSPSNPVVGLEGRAGLLQRLGAALQDEARRGGGEARPALLFDRLTAGGTRSSVSAAEVLGEVLRVLGPIWTSGSRVQGLLAGDVWPHRWAGNATGDGANSGTGSLGPRMDPTTGGWVPFHKLSQWLSYSLLEPLQWAGVTVTGLDALTGLPEYRNGGLLLDAGVLVPRDPRALGKPWKPQDDFIIEWRALTVALLDEVAVLVRERLGKTAEELPLACVLEGGTWAAGREIAKELRPDGAPPLKIESDGTIF
ncbi:uracil phosphoribosyltransferase [beta proteobacterium AAP121]|nr:uracil phosphoribosyltransferase [beta proteobacterium AAP65]KPF97299.1 uracil phosphoribosyltransferase [beta proteobacterium AAP121]